MFSSKSITACVDSGSDTADVVKESCCGWVIVPKNIDTLAVKMKEIFEMDRFRMERNWKRKVGNTQYNVFPKKHPPKNYNTLYKMSQMIIWDDIDMSFCKAIDEIHWDKMTEQVIAVFGSRKIKISYKLN